MINTKIDCAHSKKFEAHLEESKDTYTNVITDNPYKCNAR